MRTSVLSGRKAAPLVLAAALAALCAGCTSYGLWQTVEPATEGPWVAADRRGTLMSRTVTVPWAPPQNEYAWRKPNGWVVPRHDVEQACAQHLKASGEPARWPIDDGYGAATSIRKVPYEF